MRILVTGGYGFIGSNFIRHILTKYPDYSVINLDKLTYAANLDNLKEFVDDKRYRFVKADICEHKVVCELLSQVDAVVNFAAETHVDRSIKDSQAFIHSNIKGVNVLLDCLKKHKNVKRFIQISTDEVYGSIKEGSFSETDNLNPSSPYAASKASADLLCMSYYKTYGCPVIITRSTNNFGEYQYKEKLIPLLITNAFDCKKLPIYGDGKNVRDWLYVKDNCEAIDLVLHKGNIGEIYNIGAGNEFNNLEIVNMILCFTGISDELVDMVEDRLGHDYRYSVNFDKIKLLGFEPNNNFEDLLAHTIEWYEENESWYNKENYESASV